MLVAQAVAACDPVWVGSDSVGGNLLLSGRINGADRVVHAVGDEYEIAIVARDSGACTFAGNSLTLDTRPCQLANAQMTDLSSTGHLIDGWHR